MNSPRILIVDDEPGIRTSLSGVLTDEGYTVATAASGETGLEELARVPLDLVLLDIWLDGIDGLETLTRIQDFPFDSRPAVVMISGHGNIETAVKATKLGAYDFLEKPLSIEKTARHQERHRASPLAAENTRLRHDTDRSTASLAKASP